jgi:hypothetical protein
VFATRRLRQPPGFVADIAAKRLVAVILEIHAGDVFRRRLEAGDVVLGVRGAGAGQRQDECEEDRCKAICHLSPIWHLVANDCGTDHGPFLDSLSIPSHSPRISDFQKLSLTPNPNQLLNPSHPVPREGALAIVTDVGAGSGGRGCAFDE